MDPGFDGELVVAAINEFYSTTDGQRRHELDEFLCKFKTDYDCLQTVATCMQMISSPNSSANVRYFGTNCLYNVIRLRSEELVADVNIHTTVKSFLIESLTAGTYAQTQSVLNKLSAALALLTLYCIPDLWMEPVADMTSLWAPTPELLLKVLSDLAAEFPNVVMPLNQRSKLKTTLHLLSTDIIKIIWTVLSCGDATASTKQAAVECVEQWIRIPGVVLENWSQVLSVVLEAVATDCTALANILDILSENDELPGLYQLLLDICSFIVVHVSRRVGEELKDDGCSEEIVSLVSATCCLAEKAVPTLVEVATQAGNDQLLLQMIQMMQAIANLPGKYPIDEKVSDLPSIFLTTLRSDLLHAIKQESRAGSQLFSTVAQSYAQILHTAVYKFTYPTFESFQELTKEDQDSFDNYRKNKSEVSVDSYYLSGTETLTFLNSQLEEALSNWDVNRSEAIFYLWENAADYLSELDYPNILNCLQIIATRSVAGDQEVFTEDTTRRGNTLMRLLYALSHLIQEHDQAKELEKAVIPVILSYIPKLSNPVEALNTLQKYIEDRPESLEDLGEAISQTCYAFFNVSEHPKKLRLSALTCIGYVLSRRKPADSMEIVCRILNQHVGNEAQMDGMNDNQRIELYSFQINIFSALFLSLKLKDDNDKNNADGEEEPTIVLILREATPVFERICEQVNGGRLVDDVCDAVRSGLSALPEKYLPLFFPFVFSLLNSALLTNANSACSLAKTAVLLCGPSVMQSIGNEVLYNSICSWFELFEQRKEQDVQLEEWLSLVYQIIKKHWVAVRSDFEPTLRALRSALNTCSYTIVHSQEPNVVKIASQTLASISSQTVSRDDHEMKQLLAKYGKDLIKAIFERIQRELMRPTVEALAEVLFFYFQQFTTETRQVLNYEPYGNTPLVAAMFRDIKNLRRFKQMTIRFNNAAIRDAGSDI